MCQLRECSLVLELGNRQVVGAVQSGNSEVLGYIGAGGYQGSEIKRDVRGECEKYGEREK